VQALPEPAGDPAVVAAAAVVGLAAVLGGAFYPEPRFVIGCLFALVLGWAAARMRGRLRLEELLMLAVIGWGAGAAVVLRVAPLSAKVALTAWLVAVVLWVITRRAGAAARRMTLAVLTATAALLALGVVFEFAVVGSPRVGGLLENQNTAAALLVPTMVAVVGLGREYGRAIAAGLMVLMAAAVLLTGSRAGVVAAAIALVVMLPAGRARRWACVAAAAIVVAAVGWRLAVRPDTLAWHRAEIWRAVLTLVGDRPLAGVSPGGLADVSGVVRIAHPELIGQHQKFISYAESTPLGVLVQTGAVGLALVLAAAVLWFRAARLRGLLAAPVGRGTVACLVVLAAVHDQTGADIVLWWWAVLVGALEPAAVGADVCFGSVSRWARTLAGLGLAGLVLWGMAQPSVAHALWRAGPPTPQLVRRVHSVEPWYAEPARWRTMQLLSQTRWGWETAAEALHSSSVAVSAHPGRAQLWADLGRVNLRLAEEVGRWPGSVEAARAALTRASDLEPRLPWYWAERALLERQLGRLAAARELTGEALAVEPHFVRGWLLLARVELDLGRLDEARAALAKARAASELRWGRLLTEYERQILFVPRPQLESLEEALP